MYLGRIIVFFIKRNQEITYVVPSGLLQEPCRKGYQEGKRLSVLLGKVKYRLITLFGEAYKRFIVRANALHDLTYP